LMGEGWGECGYKVPPPLHPLPPGEGRGFGLFSE